MKFRLNKHSETRVCCIPHLKYVYFRRIIEILINYLLYSYHNIIIFYYKQSIYKQYNIVDEFKVNDVILLYKYNIDIGNTVIIYHSR